MKLFDLFARLPDGKLFSIESVQDVAEAEDHATRLLHTFRECFVYSERDRLIVKRIGQKTTQTGVKASAG